MTGIPTWHERAMAHPDHQSGMISEDMIRARMGEEIEDLRAEVERLRTEKDKLREEKEVLHVAVARIERAAAGAIYSQESIYVMASSALEALEDKR